MSEVNGSRRKKKKKKYNLDLLKKVIDCSRLLVDSRYTCPTSEINWEGQTLQPGLDLLSIYDINPEDKVDEANGTETRKYSLRKRDLNSLHPFTREKLLKPGSKVPGDADLSYYERRVITDNTLLPEEGDSDPEYQPRPEVNLDDFFQLSDPVDPTELSPTQRSEDEVVDITHKRKRAVQQTKDVRDEELDRTEVGTDMQESRIRKKRLPKRRIIVSDSEEEEEVKDALITLQPVSEKFNEFNFDFRDPSTQENRVDEPRYLTEQISTQFTPASPVSLASSQHSDIDQVEDLVPEEDSAASSQESGAKQPTKKVKVRRKLQFIPYYSSQPDPKPLFLKLALRRYKERLFALRSTSDYVWDKHVYLYHSGSNSIEPYHFHLTSNRQTNRDKSTPVTTRRIRNKPRSGGKNLARGKYQKLSRAKQLLHKFAQYLPDTYLYNFADPKAPKRPNQEWTLDEVEQFQTQMTKYRTQNWPLNSAPDETKLIGDSSTLSDNEKVYLQRIRRDAILVGNRAKGWGLFSLAIPTKTGQQCQQFYNAHQDKFQGADRFDKRSLDSFVNQTKQKLKEVWQDNESLKEVNEVTRADSPELEGVVRDNAWKESSSLADSNTLTLAKPLEQVGEVQGDAWLESLNKTDQSTSKQPNPSEQDHAVQAAPRLESSNRNNPNTLARMKAPEPVSLAKDSTVAFPPISEVLPSNHNLRPYRFQLHKSEPSKRNELNQIVNRLYETVQLKWSRSRNVASSSDQLIDLSQTQDESRSHLPTSDAESLKNPRLRQMRLTDFKESFADGTNSKGWALRRTTDKDTSSKERSNNRFKPSTGAVAESEVEDAADLVTMFPKVDIKVHLLDHLNLFSQVTLAYQQFPSSILEAKSFLKLESCFEQQPIPLANNMPICLLDVFNVLPSERSGNRGVVLLDRCVRYLIYQLTWEEVVISMGQVDKLVLFIIGLDRGTVLPAVELVLKGCVAVLTSTSPTSQLINEVWSRMDYLTLKFIKLWFDLSDMSEGEIGLKAFVEGVLEPVLDWGSSVKGVRLEHPFFEIVVVVRACLQKSNFSFYKVVTGLLGTQFNSFAVGDDSDVSLESLHRQFFLVVQAESIYFSTLLPDLPDTTTLEYRFRWDFFICHIHHLTKQISQFHLNEHQVEIKRCLLTMDSILLRIHSLVNVWGWKLDLKLVESIFWFLEKVSNTNQIQLFNHHFYKFPIANNNPTQNLNKRFNFKLQSLTSRVLRMLFDLVDAYLKQLPSLCNFEDKVISGKIDRLVLKLALPRRLKFQGDQPDPLGWLYFQLLLRVQSLFQKPTNVTKYEDQLTNFCTRLTQTTNDLKHSRMEVILALQQAYFLALHKSLTYNHYEVLQHSKCMEFFHLWGVKFLKEKRVELNRHIKELNQEGKEDFNLKKTAEEVEYVLESCIQLFLTFLLKCETVIQDPLIKKLVVKNLFSQVPNYHSVYNPFTNEGIHLKDLVVRLNELRRKYL